MKRVFSLVLSLLFILILFTGCGNTASQAGGDSGRTEASTAAGGGDSSGEGGNDAAGGGNGGSVKSGDIYKTPGDELSEYVSYITAAESPFTKAIEDVSGDADMDILAAQMTLAAPELSLSFLGMYDLLSLEDTARKEGTLALSGYQGVREKKGDEITFTGSKEYTEDSSMNKKGDKVTEQGTLNTSKNTLMYEYKLERGGKVISRTIIETAVLEDGTCLLQYMSSNVNSDGSVLPVGNAAFKRYNGSEYTALAAGFDSGADFKYDSIIGKGDVQADTMAAKYTIKGRFTVKDGKAEIAKK